MMDRYSLSPMKEVWTLEAQYRRWFEVECAVVKAFEKFAIAPPGTEKTIRHKVTLSVEEILAIERTVEHDVIAFIQYVNQFLAQESVFFHKGLTSSDIVDTALSLAIQESGKWIQQKWDDLLVTLRSIAFANKKTLIMGRTHGIHAEPTSFGLKFLSFYSEAERNKERFAQALEEIRVGTISGAVGNYANISPEIEEEALRNLQLKACDISTQVLPRDLHAHLIQTMALMASNIERIALEIRHLQKTEVREVQEPFSESQKGSSAMPHKRNPIVCERLCGLARLIRNYSNSALEDIALWHERDISHSSVERMMIPDAFLLLFYIIEKMNYTVKNLILFPERMKQNFRFSFRLIYSQKILLALMEKGLDREASYAVVQKIAFNCWDKELDFIDEIRRNPTIMHYLTETEIEGLANPEAFLANVDILYSRFE